MIGWCARHTHHTFGHITYFATDRRAEDHSPSHSSKKKGISISLYPSHFLFLISPDHPPSASFIYDILPKHTPHTYIRSHHTYFATDRRIDDGPRQRERERERERGRERERYGSESKLSSSKIDEIEFWRTDKNVEV
jgi:hypothetical protein